MANHPHFLWTDLFRAKKRNSNLIRSLSENTLFKTLSRLQLRYLSNFVYERNFKEGEKVFGQGDRGIGMYLIVSGRIAITTQSGDEEVLVTELGEGSFFGELALVDPQHLRSANGLARENSVLIGFFKPDLEEILRRNPSMGVKILYQLSAVLARRLLETTHRITRLRDDNRDENKNGPTGESRAKAA